METEANEGVISRLRKLSFMKRILLFLTVFIVSNIGVYYCLQDINTTEKEVLENYDYSKIKEYNGYVREIDSRTRNKGLQTEVDEIVFLIDGRQISIYCGSKPTHKKGEVVKVYTDDEKHFSYTVRAVALGNSIVLPFMIGCAITFVPILTAAALFGWKGALTVVFLEVFCLAGMDPEGFAK